jgi:hypothetical protein
MVTFLGDLLIVFHYNMLQEIELDREQIKENKANVGVISCPYPLEKEVEPGKGESKSRFSLAARMRRADTIVFSVACYYLLANLKLGVLRSNWRSLLCHSCWRSAWLSVLARRLSRSCGWYLETVLFEVRTAFGLSYTRS